MASEKTEGRFDIARGTEPEVSPGERISALTMSEVEKVAASLLPDIENPDRLRKLREGVLVPLSEWEYVQSILGK